MKQPVALCACLIAFGIAAEAGAQPLLLPPPPSAHVHAVPMATLPPYEIVALMRSIGLRPLHRPVREGPTYAMRAVDPIGEEVRVVVDARSGRILRIEPVLIPPNALPMVPAPYGRPPGRIVMLPDGPTGRIAELPPGGPPGHPASIARPAAGAPAASGPQGSVPPLPRPRPKVAATQSPAKPVTDPQSPAPAAAPSIAAPAQASAPPSASSQAKASETPATAARENTGTVAAPTPPSIAAEQHE